MDLHATHYGEATCLDDIVRCELEGVFDDGCFTVVGRPTFWRKTPAGDQRITAGEAEDLLGDRGIEDLETAACDEAAPLTADEPDPDRFHDERS